MRRCHYCAEIDKAYVGKNILVYGWINRIRELGGLTFIDLRDRSGILQVVFDSNFKDIELLKKLGREFVVEVGGEIVLRDKANPNIPSGEVELRALEIKVLSESQTPPFAPEEKSKVSEEMRYKYRYLDLRSIEMQEAFRMRSKVDLAVRKYLDDKDFLNIETPVLNKATPEGARDYLVPSRIYKGRFFALPQSPQIYKQLLMASGFERYYQIAKCFRDEDLRADRQPEFTQIDIECSFMEEQEFIPLIEGMIAEIFNCKGIKIPKSFPVMSYKEAIESYGSDKPDLRIPFKLKDVSAKVNLLNSNILNSIVEDNGVVVSLVMPDVQNYSRKSLDKVNDYIRSLGGKGVTWLKKQGEGFKASFKSVSEDIENFFKELSINDDQIVFLLAGKYIQTYDLAGKLREHLGKDYINEPDELKFLWIKDFPLFFYNEDEDRLDSNHHPFTAPCPQDEEKLETNPLEVNSIAYDLVLNGVELGGGSKRIHDFEMQKKIFKLLKLSDKEIEDKFGFFLEALKYGTPPHMGIAFGLDRIVMLLMGLDSIREVIAFPKSTSSMCMLSSSPSFIEEKQLNELGIKINREEK